MCTIKDETLALYAGEELPARKRDAIAAHVADCTECRQRMAGYQATQVALRTLAGAQLDAETGVAMRREVIRRALAPAHTPTRMPHRVAAGLIAAGCAILMVVAGAVAFQGGAAPQTQMASAPRAPQSEESGTTALSASTVPAAHTPREPLVVKMLTNDPNIVVYWIGGE